MAALGLQHFRDRRGCQPDMNNGDDVSPAAGNNGPCVSVGAEDEPWRMKLHKSRSFSTRIEKRLQALFVDVYIFFYILMGLVIKTPDYPLSVIKILYEKYLKFNS
jgi:hypothetical protein